MDSVSSKVLYFEGTIRVLILYLVHLKVKARSQKGHEKFEVTNRSCDTCFLVNFGQGIRLLCPMGHVKQFSAVGSEGQVRVR